MSSYPTIDDLKKQFHAIAFKNKEENLQKAIEMAYADMSRRQEGHTAEMKTVCVKWLEGVFTDSLQTEDFNAWHKKTCKTLIEKMNSVKPGFGTVGKAQKVINMAFKYLSCISDQYDGILAQCHMTLDGYTLDWYKTHVMPWAKEKDIPVPEGNTRWSKIEQYADYMRMQDAIRKYLKQIPEYDIEIGSEKTKSVRLPDSPFDAEFVIWEGNMIKGKYNSLVKALNNYIQGTKGEKSGREKDEWLIGSHFDDFLRAYCKKV